MELLDVEGLQEGLGLCRGISMAQERGADLFRGD